MARGREAGARGWQRTGGEGDGTSAGGLVRFEAASSRTGAILATYANQVPYDLKNAESGRGDTGSGPGSLGGSVGLGRCRLTVPFHSGMRTDTPSRRAQTDPPGFCEV